jgi:methyl halide transferase
MITSVNNPEFWDEIYKEKLNRWDLKTPTPVFLELLNKESFKQKSSLLIAGCGKGYDAFEAADFGLNVSAVDFSLEEFSDGPPLGMDEKETIKIFSEFLSYP